ncbi:MAG: lactobin A/cerein 7B family class IIb bacteriocin [Bacteroidales bacterium]|nr:lactobin A/cerein 7B family class IIb bacteriocin [Bacteroidales bacterium]
MTNLDLNAYGVTEMSHAEKVENDGGWLWAVVGVAIYIYDNWDDIKEGLSKGYEDQGKEY